MYTNYLLLQKFITNYNLNHVSTPKTYLVHVPSCPKDVQDNNYMVIQEKITKPLTALHDHPEAWSNVSEDALQELFMAAKVGLWGVNRNLTIDEEGNFVLLDLEQPNNSDPRSFFNKQMDEDHTVWGDIRGSRAWARYVVDGLDTIKTMLQKASEKFKSDATLSAILEQRLALWKSLIKANPHFVDQVSPSQQTRMNNLAND